MAFSYFDTLLEVGLFFLCSYLWYQVAMGDFLILLATIFNILIYTDNFKKPLALPICISLMAN